MNAGADTGTLAAASASGIAAAAGVGLGAPGEKTIKVFELYKLSHNIKKMLGETAPFS